MNLHLNENDELLINIEPVYVKHFLQLIFPRGVLKNL